MTYITENIIAMGFPAGDMSSGFFFGYVEVKTKYDMNLNYDKPFILEKIILPEIFYAGVLSKSHGRSYQVF